MAAQDNSSAELMQLLQNKLRPTPEDASSICPRYVYPDRKLAKIWIGNASFTGDACCTVRDARYSAAQKAVDAFAGKTEQEIRQMCGLPLRNRVQEVDDIRDQLRCLRQRSNAELGGQARSVGLTAIGKVYQRIDALEQTLRDLGLAPAGRMD
jgi:hypothetical protein